MEVWKFIPSWWHDPPRLHDKKLEFWGCQRYLQHLSKTFWGVFWIEKKAFERSVGWAFPVKSKHWDMFWTFYPPAGEGLLYGQTLCEQADSTIDKHGKSSPLALATIIIHYSMYTPVIEWIHQSSLLKSLHVLSSVISNCLLAFRKKPNEWMNRSGWHTI